MPMKGESDSEVLPFLINLSNVLFFWGSLKDLQLALLEELPQEIEVRHLLQLVENR